eukprot:m.13835 g.13835  ORF g.13835 m.13835 type:complete len:119 (+) comp6980_c0_seq2:743-1099(+)
MLAALVNAKLLKEYLRKTVKPVPPDGSDLLHAVAAQLEGQPMAMLRAVVESMAVMAGIVGEASVHEERLLASGNMASGRWDSALFDVLPAQRPVHVLSVQAARSGPRLCRAAPPMSSP